MEDRILEKVIEVVTRLNEQQVEYKIVGGIAMNAQGIIRITEDLDFFVKPTRDNIDRLKTALRAVWDDPCIDDISYDDLAGDYPSVAYGPPDDSLPLDILVRMGERYDWSNVDAEVKPLGNVNAMVATPGMLYRMKRNTVRLKDRADAEMLVNLFHLEDET